MKCLIYENSNEHKSLLRNYWKDVIELQGHEVSIAENFHDAFGKLSDEKMDFAVIHHSDFEIIEAFKSIFSDTKFIGYSSAVMRNPLPRSFGEKFNKKMLENYDRIVYVDEGVDDVIEGLELKL